MEDEDNELGALDKAMSTPKGESPAQIQMPPILSNRFLQNATVRIAEVTRRVEAEIFQKGIEGLRQAGWQNPKETFEQFVRQTVDPASLNDKLPD
ncbi:hypothetical protein MMC10_001254 [Thelotrema lepadinum]|nr:hypothetical protein [Thelotrema lepadinum]